MCVWLQRERKGEGGKEEVPAGDNMWKTKQSKNLGS